MSYTSKVNYKLKGLQTSSGSILLIAFLLTALHVALTYVTEVLREHASYLHHVRSKMISVNVTIEKSSMFSKIVAVSSSIFLIRTFKPRSRNFLRHQYWRGLSAFIVAAQVRSQGYKILYSWCDPHKTICQKKGILNIITDQVYSALSIFSPPKIGGAWPLEFPFAPPPQFSHLPPTSPLPLTFVKFP